MKSSLTKKVMLGISSVAVASAMSGCGQTTYPEPSPPRPPNDSSCNDWEWNSNQGVYECDDSSSSHYRSYYHNNRYYSSSSSLHKDSSYKSYKSTLTPKKSSGFGKGSFSSGG
ncbi:aminotransferase yhxA [Paenibacillus sp. MMS18-CY102]|uniref:aminotransferase yhxA n=1 Tax=Paenibacillus sp. MMS18-CY102 TaxID=2682849 RepID=UPI0013659FE8|nr:aminotransferase yhxA [Paenibacillus sp. MMS18-CY102]MWC28128.1 aminotransferase yhxA [Paenibacillus sp. MMS18-CY102]